MSSLGVGCIAAVIGLLAIVAWASAWKTLEWLGDAEDLIELVKNDDLAMDRVWLELEAYQRRSPRRRPL